MCHFQKLSCDNTSSTTSHSQMDFRWISVPEDIGKMTTSLIKYTWHTNCTQIPELIMNMLITLQITYFKNINDITLKKYIILVCAFPYILAFTDDTIEIRLVINGNLVHCLNMPRLKHITSKVCSIYIYELWIEPYIWLIASTSLSGWHLLLEPH